MVSAELIPSEELIRDTAPYEQLIVFYLSKELIAMICTNRGIQESWNTVDLKELGLDVVIEMKGEDSAPLRVPLREYHGRRDSKTARRCAVHLFNKNMAPTAEQDLDPDFQGVLAPLPQLLTCYSLALKDTEGDREWRRIEVDFRSKTARRFFLEREGSFWEGGGIEKIPWHQIEIPADADDFKAPRFGRVKFKIPYQSRFTGSVERSSEPSDDELTSSGYENVVPLVWDGLTATLAEKVEQSQDPSPPVGYNPADYTPGGYTPGDKPADPSPPQPQPQPQSEIPPLVFTQVCTITFDEALTEIETFKVQWAREGDKHSTFMVFKNLPLVFKTELGRTNVAIYVFSVNNSALKDHLVSIDFKETSTEMETDPKTQEPVQSHITHEMLGLRDAPGAIMVMLAGASDDEIKALFEAGKLTEAELEQAMTGLREAIAQNQ